MENLFGFRLIALSDESVSIASVSGACSVVSAKVGLPIEPGDGGGGPVRDFDRSLNAPMFPESNGYLR